MGILTEQIPVNDKVTEDQFLTNTLESTNVSDGSEKEDTSMGSFPGGNSGKALARGPAPVVPMVMANENNLNKRMRPT